MDNRTLAMIEQYRTRFGFEPILTAQLGYADLGLAIEDAIETSTPFEEDIDELLEVYVKSFGGKPTTLFQSDVTKRLQAAIDSGKPMAEPDIPEGALI